MRQQSAPRNGGRRLKSKSEYGLTRAEVEVLQAVADGLTSEEAAERLKVTKRTVDFHLLNVHRKLRVNNRIMAIRKALGANLVTFEPLYEVTRQVSA